MPGGPAADAGVAVGDVLAAVDGQDVDTLRDAQDALLTLAPSTLVRLLVRRGGTRPATCSRASRPGPPSR